MRFIDGVQALIREDAATDVQGKVSREVTTAVKAGRGALDAIRRVSDADLLRAADETPDEERPDSREVTGKAKERVDPSKMGSVRNEIERRFKRIAASRGTETAKRAIAQLGGALPEVEDEEVPSEILNAVAGLAAFQKEQR